LDELITAKLLKGVSVGMEASSTCRQATLEVIEILAVGHAEEIAPTNTLTVTSLLAVHPERAAQIKAVQETPGVLWTAAPQSRFENVAPGVALKPLMGVVGDWKQDIKEGIEKGEIEAYVPKANVAIPDSFDSAENWPKCAKIIDDIRDQSACGCCWAFAGASAGSDRQCIATDGATVVPLSSQDICFCGSGFMSSGCNGGQISTPWNYIKNTGAVSGGQFNNSGPLDNGWCSDFSLPHCHHHGPQGDDPYPAEGTPGCPNANSPKCPKACDADASPDHSDWRSDKMSFTGKVQSASGEAGIQQFIMEGGPVSTAFSVYTDFEDYAGGIYHHVSGSMAGGHAVRFVGWGVDNGVKYWKVANSWNPYWGEKGYFRIVRGTNEGGIESGVIGSSADATWGKK